MKYITLIVIIVIIILHPATFTCLFSEDTRESLLCHYSQVVEFAPSGDQAGPSLLFFHSLAETFQKPFSSGMLFLSNWLPKCYFPTSSFYIVFFNIVSHLDGKGRINILNK